MRLIILGAPGSGKGTQAKRVKERYQLAHISTGDILRAEVKAGSELGLAVKEVMDAGELVSDELVLKVVGRRLMQPDCDKGWILDGFPRTRAQAEGLDRLLTELSKEMDLGLLIQVRPEEVLKRLSGRRVNKETGEIYSIDQLAHLADADGNVPAEGPAPGGGVFFQREDDKEETIRERLAIYEEQTRPVVDFYQDHDKVVEIDGSQSVDAVSDAVFSILRDHFEGWDEQ